MLAANAGIPVVIENPVNSRLWIFLPFRKLCQHFPQFVCDQCQYDLLWQKSTRLLAANVDLRPAMKTCSGRRVCSFSGARHLPLKGLKDVVFMTAMAMQSLPACAVQKRRAGTYSASSSPLRLSMLCSLRGTSHYPLPSFLVHYHIWVRGLPGLACPWLRAFSTAPLAVQPVPGRPTLSTKALRAP